MPDSFFTTTNARKRKRPIGTTASASRKPARSVNGQRTPRSQQKPSTAPTPKKRRDEELSDETGDDVDAGGIDEMDLRAPNVDPDAYESGEEDEDETPAEKRLRLAKLYLDGVKQGLALADGEFDAAEIDRELISARLKQDVLEHSGKVHLFVADSYQTEDAPSIRTRGHRFSVTGAVASPSARWLFTAGKDGVIIKWDLHTRRKVHTFHKCRPDKGKGKDVQGHTDEVWALAVSPDGRYLASGGKDRLVGVWDVEKQEWVKGFAGHRDHISALAFRKVQPNATTSTQLYSGSFDRTLKLFDLGSMGYVETLFGHQAPVLALDALRGETAVSAGGRDKTVRFWKIPEETQLVFRGGGGSKWMDDLDGMDVDHEGSDVDGGVGAQRRKKEGLKQQMKFIEGGIECVAMIDENTFVSGGDSGSIALWTTQKKKPVFTQGFAHGWDESHVDTEDMPTVRKPRWVTAIGALRYSDLFASGSWDGSIRLWKLDAKLRSFSFIGAIAAAGVINSIHFCIPSQDFLDGAAWARPVDGGSENQARASQAKTVLLVAGVGQEMRFGRWVQRKGEGVLNGALVVALHPRT
ncbi:WD40 repeat-like protein [Daedalea quercina L-15889]|uniref:WD40 repeat-like protein n=1 Tax=Daedalea quercina L-15889 TaxID=1314783 RepID=A0A165LTB0_9APHY|nr:WD40 repeat-like protein [Daedalea quercina L-15889]